MVRTCRFEGEGRVDGIKATTQSPGCETEGLGFSEEKNSVSAKKKKKKKKKLNIHACMYLLIS